MALRVREFAKTVDHTLLKPDAKEQDIVRLCKEAARYHFAAVCVPPCYVVLLRDEAPEGLAVKASGGIRTLEDALAILNAGASRLGMSSSVDVMEEAENGGLQE
jgi:deoxyribose-phosphate aldolase